MFTALSGNVGLRLLTGIRGRFAALMVAVGGLGLPSVALADHHHDRGDRDRGHVEVQIGVPSDTVAGLCEDQGRRVWVEPIYRTVCERVWIAPVTTTQLQRVYVPAEYTDRNVWVADGWGRRHLVRERIETCPARYEDRAVEVVVSPGYYQDRPRQELVTPGHWEIVAPAVTVIRAPSLQIDFRHRF